MATLLCQLTIRAECVEEFENSQRMMFVETNKEKYVRLYQSFRSTTEREYFVIMTFDNYASFIDHETSPHHEEQNAMPMIETIWAIFTSAESSYRFFYTAACGL
jgi:quinol monooxygenase YgiN